jgi:hypothetical protein
MSQEFWITNISNRNVSLADLNLTVNAYCSINLLDKKHYYYTAEQIEKSVNNGSIFRKRDKIIIRKFAPTFTKANLPYIKEAYIPSRGKSVLNIKEEKYEELNISDEQFAENSTDLDEKEQHAPSKTLK